MDEKTRNRVLLVLFLGVLMGALDIAIIAPALPVIRSYFGVGDRAGSWTFTIYVLFNLIGTPLMAKLSDRFGRRWIYVIDVLVFAVGSVVVALSPASLFGMLIAGRALQGLGAGGIFPVASAVIGDTFPPEKRGGALGLIGAVFGIAFIIGPILGGVILTFLGWQWLFLVNLPIAAVVVYMSLKLLPSTHSGSRLSFDVAGMIVLGLMLTSLALGLNSIDTRHFFSSLLTPGVYPFFLLSMVLLAIFPRIERRAQDPVLNLTLLGTRQAAIAGVLSAGAGLGEVGMVFIPSMAIVALGLDKHLSSYMLMPVVLAMAVGSPLAGRFLDRFGSKLVVQVGTALLAIGMFLLSFGSLASIMAIFILSGVIIGFGLSALLGAPIRYIMLNEAPASARTSAQGAITVFTSVGQLTSSAVVGAVAASQGGGVAGYSAAYLVIGVVAFMMVLLTFGMKNRAQELSSRKEADVQLEHHLSPASD